MERHTGARTIDRHYCTHSSSHGLQGSCFIAGRCANERVRRRVSSHFNSHTGRSRGYRNHRCSAEKDAGIAVVEVSNDGQRQGSNTTQRPSQPSSLSGGGDDDPGDDQRSNDSFQIRLDPFSQQLLLSVFTAGAAMACAAWAELDLTSAFRLDERAFTVALELSAPVLVLLGAVVAPRWAPPFKGSELERLRHNYYMTAQVLQLYSDFGEDDSDDEADGSANSTTSSSSSNRNGTSAGANGVTDTERSVTSSSRSSSSSGSSNSDNSSRSSSSSGDERARVRRRLRLEQTVGWGTISSGLALMQAFTLQPWNEPTSNSVFAAALAGRSAQQLANEFLVRGAFWGLLSGWVAGAVSAADADDGILFFSKVFAGPDAVKMAAGLALVALSLPGALWEARAVRNFVRASVVGPVRDAAIFCTGNGMDEPAYCDPKGFAMMAARRPANAAPVADVVTRTRAWRSGPESSFSSVSSLGSLDTAELPLELRSALSTEAAAAEAAASTAASSAAAMESEEVAKKAAAAADADAAPPQASASASTSSQPFSSSSSSSIASSLPRVGPTLSPSSAAFEWDSEDMAVLLRVETLQDKIAFWSSLYFQLLAAFAINGAFLASNGSLLASFSAAWLLRTGPLLLAEVRSRMAAAAVAEAK